MSSVHDHGVACPKCGQPFVLTEAQVFAIVLDSPGCAGRVWGAPHVVALAADAKAFCNGSSCGWTGTVAEARGQTS